MSDIKAFTYKDDKLSFVGKLVKGKVICPDCYDGKHLNKKDGYNHAELFLINVLPYNQHCNDCKRLIVFGGDNMMDLF
jgi:hypothetical protein